MNNLVLAPGTGIQVFEADYFNRYIAFLDCTQKTVQTYTRALRQFAKWLFSNGIKQPIREDVIRYREELKEDHKPSTVQNYIIAIRLFFQWLEQEGLYPNIANHIKGATISKEHKKDYLTSNQVKQLLQGIDRTTKQGRRDYAIITLMVTGGLRDIEVSRANIEDLTIKGDNTVLYVQGKGKAERTDFIIIPSETEQAIRDYLKDRGTVSGKEPLFVSMSNNSTGNRMSTRSISGIVKTSLVKVGLNSERLTAHSLRHTAVTLSLLGGQTLQETQQFARHTNISTTQIYAHNLDKNNNKCGNVIASAIF